MSKKRFISIVLALVMVFGLLTVPAVAENDDPVLIVLHTNDVHGRFDSSHGSNVIGHDIIAAIAEEKRETYGDIVVLLDAGDAVHGTFFVTQSRGQSAMEVMNATGFDAMAPGNHEFNYGWERLQELAAMADFPLLLPDALTDGAEGFAGYTLIERDGFLVGVFGLTTLETMFKSGGAAEMGVDWGTVEEQIEYAQEMADMLREQGADIVIALTHLGIDDEGYGTSYGIRDNTTGIDLIVDGHSHSPLDAIEQVEDAAKIVSARHHGEVLGVVYVFACGRMEASSIVRADTLEITPYAPATAVLEKWLATVDEVGREVLFYTPYEFVMDRAFERVSQTIMGNITADAMRKVTGADLVIYNSGGIRDSVWPVGPVTTHMLLTTFAFDDELFMAYVSGEIILEALEWGVRLYPALNGGFPQVSGVTFTFNPLLPPMERVSDVYIGGEPLELDKDYRLAVNYFMARQNGDGYTMLREPFRTVILPEMPLLAASFQQTMIWYFQNHDVLTTELDVRIHNIPSFVDLTAEQNALVMPLFEAGIIQGFPDGTFRPDDTLTRAQAAAMLTRLLDLPENGDLVFTDVEEDDWFAEYARATAAAGLFVGFPDGTFKGEDYLTVAQLAVLIARIDDPDAAFGYEDFTLVSRYATAQALSAFLD